MNRPQVFPCCMLAAALLAGCGGMSAAPAASDAGPRATAALMPTGAIAPNPTIGNVAFTALPGGVRVAGDVRGLAPGSEHGFHVHDKGDCGNNGDAAGGHFNPAGGAHGRHGAPGAHVGDLPALVADASGVARFSAEVSGASLTPGAANSLLGRALVVHRDRDDFASQPAGNSGPRIACAVVKSSL